MLGKFLASEYFSILLFKKLFNSFNAFASLGIQCFSNFLNHFLFGQISFSLIVFLKKDTTLLHLLIFLFLAGIFSK